MIRRPFCGMAAGFILGILSAAYDKLWVLPAAAAVLLAAGICFAHRQKRIFIRYLMVILMLFFGQQRYQSEQAFKGAYLPYLVDGMQLTVEGKLSSKEYKNNQYIYYLTSAKAGRGQKESSFKPPVSCNRIMVYSDSDDYSIGEILLLNGTVELWKTAVNEGNFDERSFYESQKTDFKLKNIRVTAVYGKESRLKEALFLLRLRLKSVYETTMNQEDAGVTATMVLGDKSLLEAETKRLYQASGISHILAISGLHISVIGMSLYRLLRKIRMGFFGAGIAAGSLMLCYGMMVGAGTSVQRAVLMFLLSVTAQAVGRSYDSLNALGTAALLILWKNPLQLFYAGFLFSFAAVLGVVWVGQNLRKGAVSFSIQLTTLPLAAWYYYEIPLYAMMANAAVLPFMSVVLFLGMAGGIAGLISIDAAAVLLYPCHLILSSYRMVCTICAGLPGAMLITGRPKMWKMVVYYSMLGLLTCRRHYKIRIAAKQGEIEKDE